MRELIVCVLLCATLVHSATIFREEREIIEPIVEAILKEEALATPVLALKTENIPVAIERDPVLVETKEEIIVAGDLLQTAEPVVAVQEPVAIVSEPIEETRTVLVEEPIVPVVANLKTPEPVFVEVVETVKSTPFEEIITEELIVPVQAESGVEALNVAEPVPSEKAVPSAGINVAIRQDAGPVTSIEQAPSVFDQVSNAIMNNPIVTAINNIRPGGNRPSSNAAPAAPAPEAPLADAAESADEPAAAPAPAPAKPATPSAAAPQNPLEAIFRPIQQFGQQIGQQVGSAFGINQPANNNAAAPAGSSPSLPGANLLESIQTGVNGFFAPIINAIRPQANSARPLSDSVDAKEGASEDKEAAEDDILASEGPAKLGESPISTIVDTLSNLVDRDATSVAPEKEEASEPTKPLEVAAVPAPAVAEVAAPVVETEKKPEAPAVVEPAKTE